ncbi:hypothetical protein [Campylobacter sp. RM16188]|uniref:hypothetical protein n=1 Tax=Campylobacter sp. RM16188 TaxID=1705725 RepID=UPI0015582537|nr:hypothetical protein [Campylobacter sp. RM16188]
MNFLSTHSNTQVEFLNSKTFTTEYVAENYGVKISTIKEHKRLHDDEILENIHFLIDTNKFKKPIIKWTLRGIIKIGMFIRSKEAKNFRIWAEQELEKAILDEQKRLADINEQLKQKDKLIEDYRAKALSRSRPLPPSEFEELNSKLNRTKRELENLQIAYREDCSDTVRLNMRIEELYKREDELKREIKRLEEENFKLQSEKFGYMQAQDKTISDTIIKLEAIYEANKATQDVLFAYIRELKNSAGNRPAKVYLVRNDPKDAE